SLTTPPCSEGVVWVVLNDTTDISYKQLSTLRGLLNIVERSTYQKLETNTAIKRQTCLPQQIIIFAAMLDVPLIFSAFPRLCTFIKIKCQ
ncbi:hypothetical protein OSTOST_16392, partial [Ostertagia ostertagi]